MFGCGRKIALLKAMYRVILLFEIYLHMKGGETE
jgi:hypothetical protein